MYTQSVLLYTVFYTITLHNDIDIGVIIVIVFDCCAIETLLLLHMMYTWCIFIYAIFIWFIHNFESHIWMGFTG